MRNKNKVTIAAAISLVVVLVTCILTLRYSYAKKINTSSASDATKAEENIQVESSVEAEVAKDDNIEASINIEEKKEEKLKEDNKTKVEDKKKQEELSKKERLKRDGLPKIVSIKMENINQYPELPTGCESVATTMLLNYYGFNLDKTTFADKYLIYADNFVTGYSGNPHSYDGGGCYSPGLVKSTNIFLDDKNSELTACNVTGATPEELYWYVACDTPVVVWSTVYMLENQPSGSFYEYRGRTYQWDRCEHCMVLCGYDMTNNTVLINDPIDGLVERDAERFWRYYENLGSMAMIIY